MPLIIGLTGGIGCGKSAASQLFSELGIDVIDTDVISQRLTQSAGLAIDLIQKEFGKDFITADNALNRSKMRQFVFSNDEARLRLENILHPLILQETLLHIEQSHSAYIILVVPLLLENKEYRALVQRILVIDCDEEQQLRRTMSRSRLTEQQVRAIMAAQVSRQTRLRNADDIVVNNHDLAHLRSQVIQLHRTYLSLSQNLAPPMS
ncbi:dephospho-CoA kinase [Nitrosomonas sp. JL21]|uniref:dephospho-CoA kinase n=1 Tax=Nitrosomonas sp. JL21 TaxID=153949 RepID=UPI00136E22BB|nr:dephospho-CoA kinase [Nitrosomonas sp. JL21]MBL8497233.1 dephospho-CoA kinase [Nitrosomonas sp.]MXS77102.1 dephospho-CoA kinase [Nitrosomonas sp. JL21]